MINRIPHKSEKPVPTSDEHWYQENNKVFILKAGPAPNGTMYADGLHAVLVAEFENQVDAEEAANAHNAKFKVFTFTLTSDVLVC